MRVMNALGNLLFSVGHRLTKAFPTPEALALDMLFRDPSAQTRGSLRDRIRAREILSEMRDEKPVGVHEFGAKLEQAGREAIHDR
ncbi:hypothetical protein ACO2RV_16985 [Ancylobacter sp. VNQ12]|uniref:hypothetical protein n=1 Tax=Ancylobacter sp. VNQ12 TaxID=3400920 RepID=UPI003C119284